MTNLSKTSEDILNCAQSLVIKGGYNGFSYADISEVVGIRKASIHHHFPSKSDLVRALVIRYRKQAEAGVAELEQQVPGPVEQLRAYTSFWEKCFADANDPFCVCALLAGQIPVLPEAVAFEVRAHFRMLSSWLTSILERGAKQRKIRLSQAAKVEAEIFMATVHGAMLSARAYGDAKVFGLIMAPLLHRLVV